MDESDDEDEGAGDSYDSAGVRRFMAWVASLAEEQDADLMAWIMEIIEYADGWLVAHPE